MRKASKVSIALVLVSCLPLKQEPSPEPPPVFTPRPIPEPIVLPEPTPTPTPEPVPARSVDMPKSVTKLTPFVIRYCGPKFSEQVSIFFDRKYPAGGLMGWDRETECKTQTIDGLNKTGFRAVSFSIDGKLEDDIYELVVTD